MIVDLFFAFHSDSERTDGAIDAELFLNVSVSVPFLAMQLFSRS